MQEEEKSIGKHNRDRQLMYWQTRPTQLPRTGCSLDPCPPLPGPHSYSEDWDYVTLPDENTHSILFSHVDDFVAVEVAFI